MVQSLRDGSHSQRALSTEMTRITPRRVVPRHPGGAAFRGGALRDGDGRDGRGGALRALHAGSGMPPAATPPPIRAMTTVHPRPAGSGTRSLPVRLPCCRCSGLAAGRPAAGRPGAGHRPPHRSAYRRSTPQRALREVPQLGSPSPDPPAHPGRFNWRRLPMSACPPPDAGRRRFVQGLALGATALSLGLRPLRADRCRAAGPAASPPAVLTGTDFDLRIGKLPVNITGRERQAIAVNGSLPAPDPALARGRHRDAAGHQHAGRSRPPSTGTASWCPPGMDGVPGLSFPGIGPGETFTYRFPVRQSGTYWYHSHSGMQEQLGLYGALVIEPREPDPVAADRDHVLVLSDWTDEDPHRVLANLKKQPDYYNFRQRTLADFFRDVRRGGFRATRRRPGHVGLDADESHGPGRRQRLHLHLPDERPGAGRRTGPACSGRASACGCASSTPPR